MLDFMLMHLRENEEKLIREVLKQLLKCEPKAEHFKNVTKYQRVDVRDSYYLCYNNLKLGEVLLRFEGMCGTFEFIPFDMSEFLEIASDGIKVNFNNHNQELQKGNIILNRQGRPELPPYGDGIRPV